MTSSKGMPCTQCEVLDAGKYLHPCHHPGHHQPYYLGEYPSLYVRSAHAVPMQCKNFPK